MAAVVYMLVVFTMLGMVGLMGPAVVIVRPVCVVGMHEEYNVYERQRQDESEQKTEDVGGVALIHTKEITLV